MYAASVSSLCLNVPYFAALPRSASSGLDVMYDLINHNCITAVSILFLNLTQSCLKCFQDVIFISQPCKHDGIKLIKVGISRSPNDLIIQHYNVVQSSVCVCVCVGGASKSLYYMDSMLNTMQHEL